MIAWIFVAFLLAAPISLIAEGDSLISVGPQSKNVTEGTTVTFKCLTQESSSEIKIRFDISPDNVHRTEMLSGGTLPGGETEINVTFSATVQENGTTVQCRVTEIAPPENSETVEALLLVQGPPAGVSHLRVEYEDVCCRRIAWEDPYVLDGVVITGYNIIVNDMNTTLNSGELADSALCLPGPGKYVVSVSALIDSGPGKATEDTFDVEEVKFDLSVQLMQESIQFTAEISVGCSSTSADNFTLNLKESSVAIDQLTSGFTQDNVTAVQIVKSIALLETLLNRHLEAVAFVAFANGQVRTSKATSFSTFDVQMASYFVNSEGKVCVECELIPWTQAQGCRVEMNCDNGDLAEEDFLTSDLPSTAGGCFPSEPSTSTLCTFLFYDIEQNGIVTSIPAVTLDEVLLMFPSTSLPSSPSSPSLPSSTETSSVTQVIVAVVVPIIVVLAVLIACSIMGIYLYKRVRKNHKHNLSIVHHPNAYQLSERQEVQSPSSPSLQYAQVETSAAGNIVLPMENNPVSYASVDFMQMEVTRVNVMMDHKQLMLFVAPRVAHKWYHVGVALALTPPFLEDIEQNCGGSPDRCISDVFQGWQEKQSRPYTWESLLIALRATGVEEMEFAAELELQVQSLQQQQQQTVATSSLQAASETNSWLQHNSNQSTPSATTSQHILNTSYPSLPRNSEHTISATRGIRLIQPGMTLDQLVGELANMFAPKWTEVGIALALTPPNLESIAVRNCQEPTMCMTGVVQHWKHHEPRPYTLRTLITVLRSIEEHEYAIQLENYQLASIP